MSILMGLDNMAPNDLANLMTVGGAALCSLMMVLFKSRCTQISILWGLWKCDRSVPGESDDEAATCNDNDNENDHPYTRNCVSSIFSKSFVNAYKRTVLSGLG